MSSSGERMENIKVIGTLVIAPIKNTPAQLKERVGTKEMNKI